MRTTLSFALLTIALLTVAFAQDALRVFCGLLLMLAGMLLQLLLKDIAPRLQKQKPTKRVAPITAASIPETPIPEHIERQRKQGPPFHIERQRKQGPPFYCGTAFCGHHTLRAAAECWQAKGDALDKMRAEVKALRESGEDRERVDQYVEWGLDKLYPERVEANWPINRSSAELRREYIERAAKEIDE